MKTHSEDKRYPSVGDLVRIIAGGSSTNSGVIYCSEVDGDGNLLNVDVVAVDPNEPGLVVSSSNFGMINILVNGRFLRTYEDNLEVL
jgi:hypothetical protein